MSKDYYKVLNVSRNATDKEIKKQYRKLSKEYHPDKNGGDKEAENKFKEISEAYNILGDKTKREHYDTYGNDSNRSGFGGFGGFSRHKRQMVNKGENLQLIIELSLEEMFTGLNKKYKFNRNETCKTCDGKGGEDVIKCDHCDGHGSIIEQFRTNFGIMQNQTICHACDGSGEVPKTKCTTCNGNGVTNKNTEVNINIPKGIYGGATMVMDSMGQGIKNGVYGDLIIKIIEKKHSKFIRDEHNIRYPLTVDYYDLILGTKIIINTIDNNDIKVTIPEFSKDGDNLRLKNKGMSIYRSHNRGDMILELKVKLPTKMSSKDKENLENIRKNNKKLV